MGSLTQALECKRGQEMWESQGVVVGRGSIKSDNRGAVLVEKSGGARGERLWGRRDCGGG